VHSHFLLFGFQILESSHLRHVKFASSHFVSQATQRLSSLRKGVFAGQSHLRVVELATNPGGHLRQAFFSLSHKLGDVHKVQVLLAS
jgi:hypothetical protein